MLFLTLIVTQAIILLIGAALSLLFARRALRPIRRAHQAQADFAANAHHQLRTPIAVMQAEIDTALVRPNQSPSDYRRVLKSIDDELRLLKITSQQLLAQAEGAPPKVTPIDLSQAASAAIQEVRPQYHFVFTSTVTPGIYSTVSTEELIILFEIFLENTQKHAGKSERVTVVHIRLQASNGNATLTYSDDGQGVASGEEKQLFKREYRGKKATTPGSGFGLAIAAELVNLHKGTIAARNLPAGGLAFVVTLPTTQKP